MVDGVSFPLATSAVGITFADAALEESVRTSLIDVETALREAVASADPVLSESGRHLIDAGGKRFRPLLVALAAEFGDPRSPEVTQASVVIELTHLATLYHDDVMDEAQVRRGAPSANARWSNNIAILAGDYLFAHASRLTSTLGPEAVRVIAETFAELVTGQMRETIGDFGTLLYCGKDWTDVQLGRRSMELMAEKLMPGVNAAIGKPEAARKAG